MAQSNAIDSAIAAKPKPRKAVQRLNRLSPYMFMAPAVIIMAIALIYPLGYMIWGSFRAWDPSQTIGEAEFVGLKNYVTLWNDPNFHESLWVTLKFAFFCVSIEMFVGVGPGPSSGPRTQRHVASADHVHSADDDCSGRGGPDVALHVSPDGWDV